MSDPKESILLFEPDPDAHSRLDVKPNDMGSWVLIDGNVLYPLAFERAPRFERASRDTDNVFNPLPNQLLRRYARAAAAHAQLEQLEGGRWYGEVYGLRGVWADGETPDEVINTLVEVVRDWAMLKIDRGERDLPVVDSIDLNVI
jgi:UPF0150-like